MGKSTNSTTTKAAVKVRNRICDLLADARLKIEYARADGIDVSSACFDQPCIAQAVAALTAQVIEWEADCRRQQEADAAAWAEWEAECDTEEVQSIAA
jgi:hypothetical protein